MDDPYAAMLSPHAAAPPAADDPYAEMLASPPSSSGEGGGMWENFKAGTARQFHAGVNAMQGANPLSEERRAAQARGEPPSMLAVPRAIGGAMQATTAPIVAAGGQGLKAITDTLDPLYNRLTGRQIAPLSNEQAESDFASQILPGLAPGRGRIGYVPGPGVRGPYEIPASQPNLAFIPNKPPPVPPQPNGPLGVTLSEGQATGDINAIRKEQAAKYGQLGPKALQRASQFGEQQAQEVQSAAERIRTGFDPFNQTIAATPGEAGQVVSEAVQQTAANTKAAVGQAYDRARGLGGEVHADAFRNVGDSIKTQISNSADPVIVNERTPYASQMIDFLDKKVGQLNITNKASPTGQPPNNQIVGVSLDGVDQWRKTLSNLKNAAYKANPEDGRAASAVLNAFDDHVNAAVNSGMFSGDQRAVQAWNVARAAHTDYKSTFSAGRNDPVGRVMEQIIGKGNAPAAIPEKVADFIYGASGLKPTTTNVNVAARLKTVLGEQSPEWSAVKQGLFSRLIETPQGVTDWGPQKISNNLSNFLNGKGKDIAETIFSPEERALLRQYADLQQKMIVPQGGANASGTSIFNGPMFKKISGGIAGLIGVVLGNHLLPGMHGAGEIVGGLGLSKGTAAVENIINARQVSRQMPIVADALQKWTKAAAAWQKSNSGPARVALSTATTSLGRALQNIGIDVRQLAVPGQAPAEQGENQNEVRGGVGQQPNQGEQGQPQHSPNVPPITGARKAPDGNWYVPDKSRPGKYLQVIH